MDFVERKIGDLTVRIDRRTCIGSANCIKVAPSLFQLDDEGIVAFAAGAERVTREAVIDACSVCPVEAFEVLDESGERIVP
ncbi:MAG: ferredoxin [bacterium]